MNELALAIPARLRVLYKHWRSEITGYLVVSGGVIGTITYIDYTVPEAYHRHHERNKEQEMSPWASLDFEN